ncbi:MAG TPA: hypothetical protein P5301_00490 [Bacteroidales bacterium]|nr:hypothetical protein [Bacteroidales bacterium]HRR51937.1 hypothetical protein [Bacteroidales bacterium]
MPLGYPVFAIKSFVFCINIGTNALPFGNPPINTAEGSMGVSTSNTELSNSYV